MSKFTVPRNGFKNISDLNTVVFAVNIPLTRKLKFVKDGGVVFTAFLARMRFLAPKAK